MKSLLFIVFAFFSARAFCSTGLDFTCTNFELGEKDKIKITVELVDIACQSTTPFPCWRAEGWMTITNNGFQDRLMVRHAPDYNRFYVYPMDEEERKGKNQYTVRSDDRLIKEGIAPGTLEIKFPNTPFDKKIIYVLNCKRI
jgi:hypothetical protein